MKTGFGEMMKLGVVGAWAAVLVILAPVGGRAENNVTTTIDGVTTNLPASYTLGNAGTNNWLFIRNGGIATNNQTAATGTKIGAGSGGNDNHVVVSGPGSMWVLTGTYSGTPVLQAGAAAGCYGNTIAISNGASIVFTTNSYNFTLGMPGASNNIFYMGGSGAVSTGSVAKITVGGGALAVNNQVIVTNAVLTSSAMLTIGTTAISNSVYVYANSLWDFSGQNLEISKGGTGSANDYNSLTINAGIVTNVGSVVFGTFLGSKLANSVVITNGGRLYATTFNMAMTGTATNNSVKVVDGGLLEANTLQSAANSAAITNTTIRNEGGIFQFTTAAPTITPGTFGNIAVANGTISFRAVSSGLNLTNNWNGSQLTNVQWTGNNTLRLDNSTATNGLAGGYLFDTGRGATNYCRLELINGTTAIRGQGITIGGNGTALFSNTAATIVGAFTNQGTMTVVDSLVTIGGGCVLQGGSIVWATNAVPSNLVSVAGALTTSGSITVDATRAVAGSLTSPLVLFHATGAINDTATWSVTPAPYMVRKRGEDLVLAASVSGTLIMIR